MSSLALALALISFAPAAASAATATRLDGTAVEGELRSWSESEVVLGTSAGEERLPTKHLLSLRLVPPGEVAAHTAAQAHVELLDGTLLPLEDFRSAGTKATVELAGLPSAGEKSLVVAKRKLSAVQLQDLEGDVAAQWQEIRSLDPAADLLVLLKRGGKSLDYVEGIVGDVSPEKIEFELDGDALHIDREKVAGFIYFRKEGRAPAEPTCELRGRSGLRAQVARARLDEGMIQMVTAGGVELRWPLDDLFLADFSAGKLVYLSDLEPASERWVPLVGLPAGADLAAEYGKPRRDQSAYGGPLTLSVADPLSSSPVGQTRTSHKGLALHSRTELVYRLPSGFRRFTATAGIDPATSASGHVRLEIHGDDQPLLEAEIAGHDPPQPIELDISSVKQLKIVVDYGQNLDTGDWLNLCDARIVK